MLLHQCAHPPVPHFLKTDIQFYPCRSEIVDVSNYAESIMQQSSTPKDLEAIPLMNPDEVGILNLEVWAGDGPITHINYSE